MLYNSTYDILKTAIETETDKRKVSMYVEEKQREFRIICPDDHLSIARKGVFPKENVFICHELYL